MASLPARLRQHAESLAGSLPRPFWVLWMGLFVNRLGGFVMPFLAVYLTQGRGLSPATAGAVASLYGLGGMVASPLGGTLADHLGRRRTMLLALVAGAATVAAVALGAALAASFLNAAFGFCLGCEVYLLGRRVLSR